MVQEVSPLEVALQAALESTDIEQATSDVHRIVADEVSRLDPDASVRSTEYFNHSFVPDLLITWRSEGAKAERPLYVRHSIESAVAGRDLSDLGKDSGPIFLSIRGDNGVAAPVEKAASRGLRKAPESMLTTSMALSTLTGPQAVTPVNPLVDVVRANLVRSGRGFVDDAAAETLSLSREAIDQTDVEEFNRIVSQNFAPEGVVRIQRVSEIVAVAISEDGERARHLDLNGRLTASEVRSLIPYLLRQENVTTEPLFWSRMAKLIRLSDLESLADSLRDLDLSRLVLPGLSIWTASRSQLSLRSTPEVAEPADVAEGDEGENAEGDEGENAEDKDTAADSESSSSASEWRIRGRSISADVGAWTVHVASDSRKLRGRSDSVPSRWSILRPALAGVDVVGVQLNGLDRRFSLRNEGIAGVVKDVDQVVATVQDAFHVPRIDVLVSTADDSLASATADFTTMLVTASNSDATARGLVEAAVRVLGSTRPVDGAELSALLAVSEDGDEAETNGDPESSSA